VLLLRHPLAALLDDRAHQASIFLGTTADGHAITLTRDGRLGTRPKFIGCVNAYRSRSPLAYLLPHSGVTAWSAIGAQSPVARAQAAGEARAGQLDAGALSPGIRVPVVWRPAPEYRTSRMKADRTHAPGAAAVPVFPAVSPSGSAQPVPTNAARRY
jgi:hypothetical protein